MTDQQAEVPTVTVQLIRGLIDDGRDNAVLHLERDSDGDYQLKLWVEEEAGDIVLSRRSALECIADAPAEPMTDEEIQEYLLEDTQRTVDEMVEERLRWDAEEKS